MGDVCSVKSVKCEGIRFVCEMPRGRGDFCEGKVSKGVSYFVIGLCGGFFLLRTHKIGITTRLVLLALVMSLREHPRCPKLKKENKFVGVFMSGRRLRNMDNNWS